MPNDHRALHWERTPIRFAYPREGYGRSRLRATDRLDRLNRDLIGPLKTKNEGPLSQFAIMLIDAGDLDQLERIKPKKPANALAGCAFEISVRSTKRLESGVIDADAIVAYDYLKALVVTQVGNVEINTSLPDGVFMESIFDCMKGVADGLE
jgi:hypothetical protein